MLRQIERFNEEFAKRGWTITTPEIVQVMTEPSLIALVPEHDGWIIGDDPATDAVLSAGVAGKLRAGVRWGIGVDNVDFKAAKRLGLPIRNTPGVFGAEVADLAMHYVVGLARRTYEIDRGVRSGNWPKPAGTSLSGKKVALVGFGDIGRNFARRAHAADMSLYVYDPAIKNTDVIAPHELRCWPDGLSECDYVVLTCALTHTSKKMVNAQTLSLLPNHAMLVNVARGGLVDENALIEALSSGGIAGAALEVFENEPPYRHSPLLQHPNCIYGSHNASNTIEAVDRASRRAISILEELLLNKKK